MFLVGSSLLLMVSCQSGTELVCTDQLVPSVTLAASDPVLPRLEVDPTAGVATITEGSFVDTLAFGGASAAPDALFATYLHHGERPGTYVVTLTLAPYKTWSASGVRVVRNGCHVTTAQVHATLVR
jgi:hypothetical protein